MTNPDLCCPDGMERLLSPEFFKSLSDPVRLQVVTRLLLSSRAMTVTEVQGCCGVHLSGVSRHLAALKAAGVLQATKSGREVRYRLLAEDLSARLRALADALDSVRADVRANQEGAGSGCCDPA